ncbi:unnamed protein product [Rhizophagus irregularis]|uniref:Uncharacterized protein n=1 Tax=Rhizophagus irregularis TaxID=588596 RepID=A0A915ZPS8_9GLOM|nr:unnamed protein product [Rhizophagus irregularis]
MQTYQTIMQVYVLNITQYCFKQRTHMFFIVVQINEGTKILTGPLTKEVEENDLFLTLFDSLTPENYLHHNVHVEVRNKDTGSWITVHEELESKLLLMKMLEFTKLKYVILPSDIAVSSPSHIRFPNTFTRLMEFKLQLPVQKYENTRNILLYNHIIQLLQNKNVGWIGGDHLTYGT